MFQFDWLQQFAYVLQADRDPGRSHTYRAMKIKVKLEVNDMRYHFEITEEIREKSGQKEFREIPWNSEFHRNGLVDFSGLI